MGDVFEGRDKREKGQHRDCERDSPFLAPRPVDGLLGVVRPVPVDDLGLREVDRLVSRPLFDVVLERVDGRGGGRSFDLGDGAEGPRLPLWDLAVHAGRCHVASDVVRDSEAIGSLRASLVGVERQS